MQQEQQAHNDILKKVHYELLAAFERVRAKHRRLSWDGDDDDIYEPPDDWFDPP